MVWRYSPYMLPLLLAAALSLGIASGYPPDDASDDLLEQGIVGLGAEAILP